MRLRYLSLPKSYNRVLDPERKRSKRPRCYGRMRAFPMPWFAYIWPETQQLGEKDYAENPRRKTVPLREGLSTFGKDRK
jgi:hypothetical protein